MTPRHPKWDCTVCGTPTHRDAIKNVRVNFKMIHDLCARCINGLASVKYSLEAITWEGEGKDFHPVFRKLEIQLVLGGERPLDLEIDVTRSLHNVD